MGLSIDTKTGEPRDSGLPALQEAWCSVRTILMMNVVDDSGSGFV